MRPNRLIAAVLCLTVAVSPGAFAQSGQAARSTVSSESNAANPAHLATTATTATTANTQNTQNTQNTPSAQNASSPATPSPSRGGPATAALTTPTASIDANVFGLYGGADTRFANRPGEKSGLQASMNALQLPDLGDGSGGTLTPQAERRLGERLMRDLRRDPDYLDDWLIRDYLNSIAARLSAAATTQYIGGYLPDFDLFPVRDPQINAFSMPGGFIGVNTGLIATTQTESELASVIGHEMGHVLQRHIARMMSTSERSGYAALAAMLFGVLAGVVAHSGDLGMGIAMGGQAFALDSQLRFSRSAEHEADRVGFQMLSAAGYDPYAMVAFFARLDRTAMGDNGVPPYLRTHPLDGERMADMEDRARRVPYRQPRQDSEYGFVRARARVLQVSSASEYRDIASRLHSEIEDQTALNVAANWYGIALAQTLMRDYDAANSALREARRAFEGNALNDASAQTSLDASNRSSVSESNGNVSTTRSGRISHKPVSVASTLARDVSGKAQRSAASTGRDPVFQATTRETGNASGTSVASAKLSQAGTRADSGIGTISPSATLATRSAPTGQTVSLAPPGSAANYTSASQTASSTNATIDVASPASAALASLSTSKMAANVVNLSTIDATPRPRPFRSSPSLDVLAAEIARLSGHDDEAVRLADIAQQRWPASHAAIETHLQALLSAHRFVEAQALARSETRADPTQPDWWLYLAQASVGANDPMQQHRAMAEKLALDGAWPSAIRQLQAARDLKSASFYDLSTISARLRDFETRYKEERQMEKDDS